MRRLVVTGLAEALVAKLEASAHASGWRRAQTVDGPRKDSQSDVTPKVFGGGVERVAESERMVSAFIRFHADRELSRIKVCLGTSVLPYLDGKSRATWEKTHADERARCFEQLTEIRRRVLGSLAKHKRASNAQPGTNEWYKSFGSSTHKETDAIDAIIESGRELVPVLLDIFQGTSTCSPATLAET